MFCSPDRSGTATTYAREEFPGLRASESELDVRTLLLVRSSFGLYSRTPPTSAACSSPAFLVRRTAAASADATAAAVAASEGLADHIDREPSHERETNPSPLGQPCSSAATHHQRPSSRSSPSLELRFWRGGHKERHMGAALRGRQCCKRMQMIDLLRTVSRLRPFTVRLPALLALHCIVCDSKCKSMPFMRLHARPDRFICGILILGRWPGRERARSWESARFSRGNHSHHPIRVT